MLKKNSKIFLAGHNGMVGSAILRKLKKEKYKNIITVNKKKTESFKSKKCSKFFKN